MTRSVLLAIFATAAAIPSYAQAPVRRSMAAKSFFYLSLGTKENQGLTEAYEAVRQVLIAHAPPNLRWQADRTPEADHSTNGELATPVGFRALNRNGQIPQAPR